MNSTHSTRKHTAKGTASVRVHSCRCAPRRANGQKAVSRQETREPQAETRVPITPPVGLSEPTRCLLRDDFGDCSDFEWACADEDAPFRCSGGAFVSGGTRALACRCAFSFFFSFFSFSFSFLFCCCLVVVGRWPLLLPASASREVFRLRVGLGLKSGDGDSTQEAIYGYS